MKHSLQLRLSQHLTLTPQLQQSIRLLQLSTLELNQELERFLQENPMLERDDEAREQPGSSPESRSDDRSGGDDASAATEPPAEAATDSSAADSESSDFSTLDDAPYSGSRDESDDGDYPQIAADSPTLRAHLLAQLSETNISDRDSRLVALLIDSLNDDGYLVQDLDEIAAMLPPELAVDIEELQIALKHLQNFEPTGVGARNLSENLMLQLASRDFRMGNSYRSALLNLLFKHRDNRSVRTQHITKTRGNKTGVILTISFQFIIQRLHVNLRDALRTTHHIRRIHSLIGGDHNELLHFILDR
jgi:RNA polymerase sigma-54 factor